MDSIDKLKLLIYKERDECIISRSLSIAVGEKYDRIFQMLHDVSGHRIAPKKAATFPGK